MSDSSEYANYPTGSRSAEREKIRKAGFFYGLREKLIQTGWYMPGSLDTGFLLLVIILLAFGVVMMFSASYVASYYKNGSSYTFFIDQLKFAILGIGIMYIASRVNFRKFNGWIAVAAVAVTFIMLVWVLFLPADAGGTKRRLYFFQPSDVAKFTLVLFLAYNMTRQHKYFSSKADAKVCFGALFKPDKYGSRVIGNKNGSMTANMFFTLWYAFIVGVCAVMIALEHHLSCTILILLIGASMLAFGGVKHQWFILAVCVIIPVAAYVLFLCKNYEQNGILDGSLGPIDGYQLKRIVAWLYKDFEPTGARWQVNNSLYAIASGGPFGLGFGESRQKQMFVSEPQNDFVFAIICEEIGFVGATLIILLFALLIYRGFVIALSTPSRFGSLLTMGIMVQVGFQVILNIMVVTDTIPNTGISLPFFSYGGTALIMLMGEMGIVLSVSRSSKKTKTNSPQLRKVTKAEIE